MKIAEFSPNHGFNLLCDSEILKAEKELVNRPGMPSKCADEEQHFAQFGGSDKCQFLGPDVRAVCENTY